MFCRTEEALAATNEVDNLVAVVRLDSCLDPSRAGENVQIALDGHAFGGQANVLEECGHIQPIGNLATLTVNRHSHGADPADGAFERERMVKRISSFAVSLRA
jgi:hypothetical protein